ncbi:Endopolyphosphatase [Lunasporangiospora selenospora]|uniref:Endopolyphosphatase n=1 Tax=Lunasporangiospora selenospora TaxID=979761 RepID=A0A9P6G315_9FUNG|nr:Endopolyphosphatase [Lunasporangiospora selenospora]
MVWSRGSVSLPLRSPQIEFEPEWPRAPRGRFLHLSDIHPDQFYLEGAASGQETMQGRTIHDSDNTHPRTQDQINQLNQAIAEKFLRISPPGPLPDSRQLPVVPSIGNNDVYPHNILAPGPNPIFQFFATLWSEFIPESQLNTFRHGGYYSSDVVPGKIRVFALNTLYFYAPNVLVDGCKKEGEPGSEEMDWLETKLESVRQKKMVAYLTGHVPPDKFSYSPTCYRRYTKIALEFQDVIVGHLFGHANIDNFFLLSRKSRKHKETPTGDDNPEGDGDNDDDSGGDNHGETTLGDPVQAYGLSTYVEDLMGQYEAVIGPTKNRDYAIALVSPAVVPTYQPTLRVFKYQVGNGTSEEPSNPGDGKQDEIDETCMENMQQETQLSNKREEAEMIRQRMKGQKKHGRKRHHRKRPKNPPPARASTFGFPLEYTQYVSNLTLANENLTPPEYVPEYNTREDYGLQDLSVPEWLTLARRIATDENLKAVYLNRLVVQSEVEGINTA